jgi:hypothetical protein
MDITRAKCALLIYSCARKAIAIIAWFTRKRIRITNSPRRSHQKEAWTRLSGLWIYASRISELVRAELRKKTALCIHFSGVRRMLPPENPFDLRLLDC